MMGIETAIIGGALSLGSSILSAKATKKAAGRAADAAQDSTDKQIALARETRDGQIARSEPFRQLELQQGNALGEIYGFNSVGDAKPQAPQSRQQPPSPYQNHGGFTGGNVSGGTRFNPNSGGGFINGAARRIFDEREAEPSFNDFLSRPQIPASVQPLSGAAPQTQAQAGPQISANGINISAQNAARERFEGSMFNDVYRAGHARDVDRIDAGLGASGLAFSGARMQAVEDARADRFGSTFNSYFTGLLGQAPQSATNAQNRAAGTFSANAADAIAANGQAQQDSAYKRGEANAGIFNTAAGLGGMVVGKSLSNLQTSGTPSGGTTI